VRAEKIPSGFAKNVSLKTVQVLKSELAEYYPLAQNPYRTRDTGLALPVDRAAHLGL
jgi:hypothetical protein